VPDWEEIQAVHLKNVQNAQAVHRRILAAKDAGEEPDPEDLAYAAAYNASPYAGFDRVTAPDED